LSFAGVGEVLPGPRDILEFWFVATTPEQWYRVSDSFDAEIRHRFQGVHAAAAQCELFEWRASPEGRLAEIIILDQFSRNILRGHAGAFAHDALALALAQEAIAAGADAHLPPLRRAFVYLPFMHSESARIHDVAMTLFSAPGLETNLDFERQHKAIIDRFGRYPHRNAVLGRESTPDELAFLATPGSSF
jgi:uncharacterized protein (DUF924 family)